MGDIVGLTAEPTFIPGLYKLRFKEISDERGVLYEFWRDSDWRAAGLPEIPSWPQGNIVANKQGTLRGIHCENMFKCITAFAMNMLNGYSNRLALIQTVHVDLRPDSPTKGLVFYDQLNQGEGMLIPPGVGNGFQALENIFYIYRFSAEWHPGAIGINPLDQALEDQGLTWPILGSQLRISTKDRELPDLTTALKRAKTAFAERPIRSRVAKP